MPTTCPFSRFPFYFSWPYGSYWLWDVESDNDGQQEGCVLRVYVNVAFSKKTVWKEGRSPTISTMNTYEASESNTIEVGQGSLKLLYSANEGKLTRYVNTRNSVTAFAEQSYGYYSGNDGTDKDPQTSLTVVRGPLLDEVHQQLHFSAYQRK
ncbi:hypothetical protein V6Z12_D09G086900 [Gossypium hirsutum]